MKVHYFITSEGKEVANSNCNHADNDVTSCPAEAPPVFSFEGTPQKNEPVVIQGNNKNPATEKLERVRKWSITRYKCTRQDDRQRYDHMTKLAQTLANQLTQFSVTQKTLGDAFADLSVKTPTLHVEFGLNAEAQRFLSKSNETLTTAMNVFTSDMNTLVNKTIEDTMINAKQYEAGRIQYDAYRAQRDFQNQREQYQRIREDLSVKVKLLQENKVKVLHQQLFLLHSAVAAHSLSCQNFLQKNVQQVSERLTSPAVDAPSWLEES
ncbi:Arfaptin-1 [Dissostichus eleginoides]|uniref:Arfaptin-1 n=1 Tax=Dissostichus eleginoides TaxID=100907 RepID=A0AAD9F245_DISEL|nr:Arfaptin-1 [Dissostichus eleginoides]